METRPYFLFGDLLANGLAGVLVGVVMAALFGPGWNMILAMFVGMALGMIISLPIALPLGALFGAMEVMVPVMTTGMVAGMVVSMASAMATVMEPVALPARPPDALFERLPVTQQVLELPVALNQLGSKRFYESFKDEADQLINHLSNFVILVKTRIQSKIVAVSDTFYCPDRISVFILAAIALAFLITSSSFSVNTLRSCIKT